MLTVTIGQRSKQNIPAVTTITIIKSRWRSVQSFVSSSFPFPIIYMFIIMQLDPNPIKFIYLYTTCTVTPRPVVPPAEHCRVPLSRHPHSLIPFHFRLSTTRTKSVGEHWQLPRLYRRSRRELLGLRVLPHGHHEYRGIRRRRLHDRSRPDCHRLFPALRTGKWAGRHGAITAFLTLSTERS